MIETLSEKSFLALFVATVLFAIATGLSAALAFLILNYFWGFSEFQIFIWTCSVLFSAVIGFLIAPWATRKLGKKRATIVLGLLAFTIQPSPVLLRLAGLMPEGVWMYPEDQVSDASERLLATEITREQLYRQLHEELPYDSMVRPEKYIERKDGSVEIHQQIIVARDNQRMIVLGKGGSMIKSIGQAAREELSELLGRKVHLFLHVKATENWAEDKEMFEEMGLDWVR